VAALTEIDKIHFDFPVESIEPIRCGDALPIITGHTNGQDVINAPIWVVGYTEPDL
jgi:hypothetical protein